MALTGRWRGWWEQAGIGRRPMYNLTLHMDGGVIEGEGEDCIGPFTFRGHYDAAGNVEMVKQYIGKHRLLYAGTYDDEGGISGRWIYAERWTGPFALRLEAADVDAELEVETIRAGGRSPPRHPCRPASPRALRSAWASSHATSEASSANRLTPTSRMAPSGTTFSGV
jgi:hypothetical protein